MMACDDALTLSSADSSERSLEVIERPGIGCENDF